RCATGSEISQTSWPSRRTRPPSAPSDARAPPAARQGTTPGPAHSVVSKKVVQPLPWGEAGDAGVWTREVVGVEPRTDGGGALRRGLVGAGVGPFSEAGLDEAFRLAVGARGLGPGSHVS